jgi:hypothetical protein
MLDFILGGLGPNPHQPVRPRNHCPPAYCPPPPIQNQKLRSSSLNYHNHNNYLPNTSCCLDPKAGSIADNIFKGSIFFPQKNDYFYQKKIDYLERVTKLYPDQTLFFRV